MTVWLDYHKARLKGIIADRDSYFGRYWDGKRLLGGAPVLLCVEGTYLYAHRLGELCGGNDVNNYIASLKSGGGGIKRIEFKWRRYD